MGLKLRGAVRCGRCRKPRGIRHTCVARMGTRTHRHKVQSPVTWECPGCHKNRGVLHTCAPKSDFRARKRKKASTGKRRQKARRAARRKQAAAERRARDKSRRATAGKKARSSRPRGDSHEPGTCGDHDCPRFGCKAYWQGMADCPLQHCSGGCA